MTPVIQTFNLATGGVLTVTTNDAGTTLALVGDPITSDFSISLDTTQSRALATGLDSAEDTRDLENKRQLQSYFEQEMGAQLLSFNSQALVKDANYDYIQTTTRLSFDSYVKGLDGHPVP